MRKIPFFSGARLGEGFARRASSGFSGSGPLSPAHNRHAWRPELPLGASGLIVRRYR
ncbi:MAG: hypothetical protein LBD67_09765 [Candidatus Accumulibacter sp.]|nr:hypothetical protein [Accumulibacter sp.]